MAEMERDRTELALRHVEPLLPFTDGHLQSRSKAFDAPILCAAEGCTQGWRKLWRKRRPIFEGDWGCSVRCVEDLVAVAVRREVWETATIEAEERHRHRVPLGLVLLAQGWITHPQLQAALQAQRASGRGRIGDWLTQSCGLDEEHITRGLGVQWGCPVLGVENFAPAAMAMVMPKRFVAEFGLLPLRVTASSLLYVAFEDKMDPVLTLALEQMSGLKVEAGLLGKQAFDEVRASVLAAEGPPARICLLGGADALTAAIVRVLLQRQPSAAKLVRVHQYYWLRLWLEEASNTGQLPVSPLGIEDHVFVVGREALAPV